MVLTEMDCLRQMPAVENTGEGAMVFGGLKLSVENQN